MAIAIKAEHVSKEYRLGVINHGMLYKDLQSWLARRRGKADPHAKIGAASHVDSDERYWALKDVNFEIEQGDRVGLIGRNGAGKSTLLKILSRITAPTEGRIGIKGRVASLLEVGTGFHPELTGRENIYLNGAILGMRRREVAIKFDEIVAFSEIEKYIDTPVKRYSSGMYVRLAFAVAAHLDSEILLADEVLAVGDAAFQKKCLGKMEDVSRNQGRTVVFVSHNMSAITTLCTSGIFLEKGSRVPADSLDDCVDLYMSRASRSAGSPIWSGNDGDENLRLIQVSLTAEKDARAGRSVFMRGEQLKLDFVVEVKARRDDYVFCVEIHSAKGVKLCEVSAMESGSLDPGELSGTGIHRFGLDIQTDIFAEGRYSVCFDLAIRNVRRVTDDAPYVEFEVVNGDAGKGQFVPWRSNIVSPPWKWKHELVQEGV